jgi:hypothetical protein
MRLRRQRRVPDPDRKAAAISRLEFLYEGSRETIVGAFGLELVMIGLYESTRISPWMLAVPFGLALACALNIVTLRWVLRRMRASVG